MTPTEHRADVSAVRRALAVCDLDATATAMLQRLIDASLDRLPQPGGGETLSRWRVLAAVARPDLSLAKLFEGHTDAVSILQELGGPTTARQRVWGVWAAESPQGRTWVRTARSGERTLWGAKCWCSGAASATHGLLTAWVEGVSHPLLMSVEIRRPGVRVDASAWQARLLPIVRCPAHGADGGPAGRPRHPPCAGTPVGAVAAHPVAPAAGRTAQAGDARVAGGARRDHPAPARSGRAKCRRGRRG